MRPHNLSIVQVPGGSEDTRLRHYLHSCRSVYLQMAEVRRRRTGSGGGGRKRGEAGRNMSKQQRHSALSSPSKMNREQVFESLRSLSRSHAPGASMEQKEKAKVEARSLEGLRQQRKNGDTIPVTEQNQKKGGRATGEQTVGSNRRSSSTDSLSSAATEKLSSAAVRKPNGSGWKSLHGSHERLSQNQRQQAIRPFTEIYISGDQSFSFSGPLGGGTSGGSRLNKSIDLLVSPEDWELDGIAGRATHEAALSLSQPDHPRSSPSPSQLPAPSLTHGLSRSVEHGLDPSPTTTRQLSTPSPRYHSDLESSPHRSSDSNTTSRGSSYTLPRTKKQSLSLSPPSSPTPPPPPSVPPPSTVNQPTFLAPGGARQGRKLPPAYPVPEGDSVATEINDLHDRIALLSNQILYEKADVFTHLHRAGKGTCLSLLLFLPVPLFFSLIFSLSLPSPPSLSLFSLSLSSLCFSSPSSLSLSITVPPPPLS